MKAKGEDTQSELRHYAQRRLEAELASLREQREKLAADLTERDPVGDRGDNAQALAGSDDLAWLDDRIAALERRLADRSFREGGGLPTGTAVTLRWEEGSTRELRVVAIPEEIIEGEENSTVTADSPLGKALVDHHVGDTITYSTVEGTMRAQLIDLRLPSTS